MPYVCTGNACSNVSSCNGMQGGSSTHRNSGERNVCKTVCMQLPNEKVASCATFCREIPQTLKMDKGSNITLSSSNSNLSSNIYLQTASSPQLGSDTFNFDETLARIKQSLSKVLSNEPVQFIKDPSLGVPIVKAIDPREQKKPSSIQNKTQQTEVMDLIKAGKWEEAKALAIKQYQVLRNKISLSQKKGQQQEQSKNEEKVLLWDIRNSQQTRIENIPKSSTASILPMLGFVDVITRNTLVGGIVSQVKDIYTVAHGESSERDEALEKLGQEVALSVGLGAVSGIVGISASRFAIGSKRIDLFAASGYKHPLAGLSKENVVRLINEMGIETPKDQAILWSGLGREGVKLSQAYANKHGGVTLEMTAGGRYLDEMNLFGDNSPFTPEEATKIWGEVSALFARQTSGQVRTLLGQVRPGSIYMTTELKEILNNKEVLGIDSSYLKPRFEFK